MVSSPEEEKFGFLNPLVVEYVDGSKWLLHADFSYRSREVAPGEVFTAPRGFYTDFASTPRFLHSIVSPTGRHGKSAVIHDLLYFLGYRNDRTFCDMVFDEAMGFEKEGSVLRPIIFYHVRAYGWAAWEHHRRKGNCAEALVQKLSTRTLADVRKGQFMRSLQSF